MEKPFKQYTEQITKIKEYYGFCLSSSTQVTLVDLIAPPKTEIILETFSPQKKVAQKLHERLFSFVMRKTFLLFSKEEERMRLFCNLDCLFSYFPLEGTSDRERASE